MSDHVSQDSPPPTVEKSRLGYIGALDGLRALAVLAVLFYHADVLWLPGGFLGVEIFFVVSGYLITSLLLVQFRSDGHVNLKQFWARRARRLLPALFLMLVAVTGFAVLFLPEEVASLRGDLVAAFTYITNWYLIAAEKSYFEVVGRPSLLRHLWSLAVEEQFYLVWPLLFVLILTRVSKRGAMWLLMLGAAASALWMGLQYQPDSDPSRIYYGTDTRAAGLLLGAALAFVWIPRGGEYKSRVTRGMLDLAGVIALAALIGIGLTWSEFDPFLYQGGMLLVGAMTALVIAAIVMPKSPLLAPILSFGILRWIGLRSYSLYLWHWPVFVLTRPQLDTTLEGTPLLIARFALTFALAELSYRLIEAPIRSGALGRAWDSWNTAQGARRWGMGFAWMGIVGTVVLTGYLLGYAVVAAQPAAEPDYVLAAPDESEMFDESGANIHSVQGESSEQVVQKVAHPIVEDVVADVSESSDMSSVSYIVPEEIAEPEDATLQTLRGTMDDSWLKVLRGNRAPLLSSIQTEVNALRGDRVENGAHAARVPQPCGAACQARIEYKEMKAGMVHFAKPRYRLPLYQVTLPPVHINATAGPIKSVPPIAPEDAQVLAIGDSVMLGASNYLRHTVTAIDVDAKIGRQVSAALRILQERQAAHLIPPVVIVHMGNNGTFSAKQFEEMMTVLKDVPRVIFLTNKVPRKWQEPNNSALAQGVTQYPNATLVDWNGTSAMHPEWFWKDGIHLRPEGAKVYANLIAEIVYQAQQ